MSGRSGTQIYFVKSPGSILPLLKIENSHSTIPQTEVQYFSIYILSVNGFIRTFAHVGDFCLILLKFISKMSCEEASIIIHIL